VAQNAPQEETLASVRPTILTCAVTGTFGTRENNPNLPCSPEEIANACLGAVRAGAAICHIHVRDPKTGAPSMNIDYYREVVKRIRDSGTNMIINLTCGPGGRYVPSDEDPQKPAANSNFKLAKIRVQHAVELKPEICTLDLNTMWFGGGAVINSPKMISEMAGMMYGAGLKPEFEVFDSGDIQIAHDLIAAGVLKSPGLYQIVTGIKYGFAPTPQALMYAQSILPPGSQWAAFGASRWSFTQLAMAFMLGGHCRIGMEDTLYIEAGVKTPSNAALVEKAGKIIALLGGKLATPDEARETLGLPKRKP
jgi:uncharacterized protein (DUF849 family)